MLMGKVVWEQAEKCAAVVPAGAKSVALQARNAAAYGGERLRCALWQAQQLAKEERAQGTTEYAILVGVLVVIAIIAIVAFRDRVSELWTAISDGINSL